MSQLCPSQACDSMLKCGACLQLFPTLCLLHQHFIMHSGTGSYHYNHFLKTAFPKYDTACTGSQTGMPNVISPVTLSSELHEPCQAVGHSTDLVQTVPKLAAYESDEDFEINTVNDSKSRASHENSGESLSNDCFIDDCDDMQDNCKGRADREKTKPDVTVKVAGTWKPAEQLNTNEGTTDTGKDKRRGRGVDVQRKCQECGKNIRRENYKGHMRKHKGELEFVCDICGAKYASKKVLKAHQVSKHSKVDELLHCQHCEMKFPTAHRLKEHMVKHSDSFECVCKVCDKPFRRRRAYVQHMENVHGDTRDYKCDICEKTFKWKSNYHDHIKSHTSSVLCPVCGARFNRSSSLARHRRTHEEGVKPHVCHICERGFIQKTPFWSHMEKHHDLTKSELVEMFPEKHGAKFWTQKDMDDL